jgi:hypothetical protein
MSEAEKIIYAAVAGLIIWLLQKITSHIIVRCRVTQSILTDIKLNIEQIIEAYEYLKKLEETQLVAGKKLDYIDKFTKSEVSFFASQMHDLPRYYRRSTLDKITKFYYSFWELQILIEGLMFYLNYLFKKDKELAASEIARAKKKFARVFKLMDVILKNKVKKLSDLIQNYEGRLPPDSMI